MAAKRVVHYRGQTIRLYEQSYAINSEAVVWVKAKPDLTAIKQSIDDRLAEGFALGMSKDQLNSLYVPVDHTADAFRYGTISVVGWRKRRRLAIWFDDVRDQVPIGWLLAIAFFAGSLTTFAVAWLLVTFVLTH